MDFFFIVTIIFTDKGDINIKKKKKKKWAVLVLVSGNASLGIMLTST